MSAFRNLFQQIIRSLIIKESSVNVILPDTRQLEGRYYIPDDIFPANNPVIRLPSDESVVKVLESVNNQSITTNLLLPPLGDTRKWSSDQREKYYPCQTFDGIVLWTLASKIKQGSIIVAIMTNKFLYSDADRPAREYIFKIAQPITIISQEHLWNEVVNSMLSDFQVTALVLNKSEGNKLPVRFFRPEIPVDDAHQNEIISDFKKLLNMKSGQSQFGYVIRDVDEIQDNWGFDYNDPKVKKKKQDLAKYGATRPISEIFEIFRGKVRVPPETAELVDNFFDGRQLGIPLIEGRDLLADGTINYETRYKHISPKEVDLLRPGDILLRTNFGFSIQSLFPVVEVGSEDILAAASQRIFVLRLKFSLNEIERSFIIEFLRSETFLTLLKAENGGGQIKQTSLEKMPVPIPDENMLTALISLEQASTTFNTWAGDIADAKKLIFQRHSGQNARLETLAAGRLARQRVEAGFMVEDYRHRIRTQFPHPLAYQWRVVEASRIDTDGYSHILETVEIALCFVACMAIVAVNSGAPFKIKYTESIANNLCSKKHGTSLGDWMSILDETSKSKTIKKESDKLPFYEAITLLSSDAANGAVSKLKKLRDDKSHGRGPRNRTSLEENYQIAKDNLDVLFRELDFLTEYPLRYIEETRRDSISKQTHFTYRDLKGDNPLVPIERGVRSEIELEAGSLYIVDRQNQYHLLRPLMIRKECPVCGSWSTFYLDTYDTKKGSPIMKSMEHSHTTTEPDLANPLRIVGLLK